TRRSRTPPPARRRWSSARARSATSPRRAGTRPPRARPAPELDRARPPRPPRRPPPSSRAPARSLAAAAAGAARPFDRADEAAVLGREIGALEQLRPPLERALERLLAPPARDRGVIAGEQDLRHRPAAVVGRPRVVRRVEEARVERVALDRVEV